jgi:hypothetical protein
MVTLLFTSICIFGLLLVAFYFWQKPANRGRLEPFDSQSSALPPPHSGLFNDSKDHSAAAIKALPELNAETVRAGLIERARNDDKAVLQDASKHGEGILYEEVLNLLVDGANSEGKLLSLVSHVVGNDFRVNKRLAEAIIASWEQAPTRSSTAKTLHIAALSDDPDIYRSTVEVALRFWRADKIPEMSPLELRALFDGEFWVLSSRSRSSGSGFLLKRTLANARRELEAAAQQQ